PWHLLKEWTKERGLGILIEHGHRTAGWVVGALSIMLAVGLTVAGRGAFYRSLCWVALAAVGAPGGLGVYRRNLDALAGPELAFVHGCFAQLAFATLVAVAVLTSSAWFAPPDLEGDVTRVRRRALVLTALMYAQIALGATIRHFTDPVAQRLHILLAF